MQRRKIIGLLVCAATLALPHAQAATRKSSSGKPPKRPVDKGPAESRAERDRRLQRECRGKPNAGACEGYGA